MYSISGTLPNQQMEDMKMNSNNQRNCGSHNGNNKASQARSGEATCNCGATSPTVASMLEFMSKDEVTQLADSMEYGIRGIVTSHGPQVALFDNLTEGVVRTWDVYEAHQMLHVVLDGPYTKELLIPVGWGDIVISGQQACALAASIADALELLAA